MPTKPLTLEDFAGHWVLTRVIDHADGTQATMTGTADFTPDGAGLAYSEKGLLHLTGHAPIRAERRYLWRPGLEVLFDDGRPFHTIPAGGGGAEHWCDPDHYRVRYSFDAWPRWQSVWEVTGPRKSYRMDSRYTRV